MKYNEMQWNEMKRTKMNKHCHVWKIKSAAVDGAFRSSVVMPVISNQDIGKSHTFEKPLNKVSNMKWNESFLRLGHEWCALQPMS